MTAGDAPALAGALANLERTFVEITARAPSRNAGQTYGVYTALSTPAKTVG